MKKGYKVLNMRVGLGGLEKVAGKEIEVCGVKCFQHEGAYGDTRVISEYSTGLKVGSAYGTYKRALENVKLRFETVGPAHITELIKDCSERFGVANE